MILLCVGAVASVARILLAVAIAIDISVDDADGEQCRSGQKQCYSAHGFRVYRVDGLVVSGLKVDICIVDLVPICHLEIFEIGHPCREEALTPEARTRAKGTVEAELAALTKDTFLAEKRIFAERT